MTPICERNFKVAIIGKSWLRFSLAWCFAFFVLIEVKRFLLVKMQKNRNSWKVGFPEEGDGYRQLDTYVATIILNGSQC